MAYDDYSMGGYIPGDYTTETEEERRRRLAAEQAQYQTQDQESGGITAQRPSLGDLAGQYLGRRVDAAQQRVTDAGQVFTDPAAAMERRLGVAEQPDAANTEVQSQQVKTYADGSQEEIVKRQMPAPVAPTATGYGGSAPEDLALFQAQAPQAATAPAPQVATAPAPQAQPAPQTQEQILPARPVSPEQQAQQEAMVRAVQQPENVPTPGPATQFAGPATASAMNQPFTGQGIRMPTPTTAANLQQVAEQMGQPPGEDPARQAVYNARNEKDPGRRRDMFVQVLTDKSVDPGTKALAERFIAEDYIKQRDIDQANQKIAEATPTDLARYMKEQKKEGSYVKAILLARLGLNALAEKEMELLSPSLSMTSMVDDKGNRYAAEIDKNGKITRAFDAVGKTANQEAVARLQASGGTLKGVEVEAGAYKDPTGKVEGTFVLERRPGGSVFREVGTNRIASPSESAILNKTGVQGTLANQRDRMIQEINLKLQGKTAEEQMTILRPYNQQLIAEGYAPLQPGDARLTAPQIAGGGAVTATGGATGTATGGATGTGGGAVTTGTGGGAVTTGTGGGAVTTGTGGAVTGSGLRLKEAAGKEKIQTSESIPREFIKLNSAAAAEAAKSAANAPQLLSTIDRITGTLERRPDFANALQSPAFTAFVVSQGADTQKRLEDLSNVARIRPQDKTEFQNLVNDLRRLEVAGITQSGLSASQLNTERESQRVIDALAITLRNTPQAARTQAEIARAQIQYQRRFAQYLASADPTQNPAEIRRKFDDTIGDKIYNDLAPKLEAIKRGGVVDFRSNP